MMPQQTSTLTGCTVLSPMESDALTSPPAANKKSKQAGQRFKTINQFCDVTLAGLNRSELAIWLLLWRDTRPEGLARASQANLAQRAGVSTRTAGRAVDALHRKGLLSVVKRGGLSQGPSTYRVHPVRKEAPL